MYTHHQLEEKPGLLKGCFPHCAGADHPLQCQLFMEKLHETTQTNFEFKWRNHYRNYNPHYNKVCTPCKTQIQQNAITSSNLCLFIRVLQSSVIMCFTKFVLSLSVNDEDVLFILNHDTIICYQLTRLPVVKMCTTFPVFCCNVFAGIKFRISIYLKYMSYEYL